MSNKQLTLINCGPCNNIVILADPPQEFTTALSKKGEYQFITRYYTCEYCGLNLWRSELVEEVEIDNEDGTTTKTKVRRPMLYGVKPDNY